MITVLALIVIAVLAGLGSWLLYLTPLGRLIDWMLGGDPHERPRALQEREAADCLYPLDRRVVHGTPINPPLRDRQ